MKRLLLCAIVVVIAAACGGGPEQPGEAAFKAANSRLTANNKQFAFGNGPVAQKLAESFNLRMKLMLKLAFKSRVPGSTVDDDIITHVNLTEDKAVFLVYVPALRNYKEDAQGTLLDVAWTLARGRVEDLEPEQERTLAVGLRGIALYGASAFGSASAEKPDTTTHTGVVDTEQFYPYFASAYPKDVAIASDEEKRTEAAPAAAEKPAGTPTELAEPGDRVTNYLGLIDTNPPATAVAIGPDLFISAEPMPLGQGPMRLARGPAIRVSRVACMPDSSLCVFRVLDTFKFDPMPVSASVPKAGDAFTAYIGQFAGGAFEVRKFPVNVTSVDNAIHTDERLEAIPQGAALVDAEGRLVGIGTGFANVYATVADVRRAISEARTKPTQ